MDVFERAWRATVAVEGGYSNNPADPGGETMYGVTVRVARAAGYSGPMRDLPLSTAREIYRSAYWAPLRLDEVAALSERIAAELFDTNVNFYVGAAARFLQRTLAALGDRTVVVDGRIGAGTIAALQRYLAARPRDGELVLLRCLNGLQVADYVRQVEANPAKAAFLFGWVRARVII